MYSKTFCWAISLWLHASPPLRNEAWYSMHTPIPPHPTPIIRSTRGYGARPSGGTVPDHFCLVTGVVWNAGPHCVCHYALTCILILISLVDIFCKPQIGNCVKILFNIDSCPMAYVQNLRLSDFIRLCTWYWMEHIDYWYLFMNFWLTVQYHINWHCKIQYPAHKKYVCGLCGNEN